MIKKISLKAARVNAKLTQKEAAEQLGISKETLANWENGKTTPNVSKFKKFEEVYKIPYDSLNFLP